MCNSEEFIFWREIVFHTALLFKGNEIKLLINNEQIEPGEPNFQETLLSWA